MGELNPAQKRGNAAALLPILVFLVLYLGCGLLFEYGLKRIKPELIEKYMPET